MSYIQMREFDKTDWDAYGGAEAPMASAPLIGEIKVLDHRDRELGAVVIVDRKGIEIIAGDDELSPAVYARMFIKFETGRFVAEHLRTEIVYNSARLADIGFTVLTPAEFEGGK